MSALPERVLGRFLRALEKAAPSKVEPYFQKVKKQNPSYSDEQAWATAWSIYCEYKNPGDESCHKDEYFPGRSKKASPAHAKKRMSMLFVSAGELPPAVAREIGHEAITIQNLEPYEEADVPLRVLSAATHEPEPGQLIETRFDVEYPVGTGDSAADVASLVRQVLGNVGKKHGARVEPCASSYHPNSRPSPIR